jgi:hypothetical protein
MSDDSLNYPLQYTGTYMIDVQVTSFRSWWLLNWTRNSALSWAQRPLLCSLSLHPDQCFFRAFSSVVRQMPGYNSQDGARPALPNFPFSVLFSYLCIMRTVCVYMCDVLLPPGVNPTAVKYYIISILILHFRTIKSCQSQLHLKLLRQPTVYRLRMLIRRTCCHPQYLGAVCRVFGVITRHAVGIIINIFNKC